MRKHGSRDAERAGISDIHGSQTDVVLPPGPGESVILVAGSTFPAHQFFDECGGSTPELGPRLCAAVACKQQGAPCDATNCEGVTLCESIAEQSTPPGWAPERTPVRVTIATDVGAVSFELDAGGASGISVSEPLRPPEGAIGQVSRNSAGPVPRLSVRIACVQAELRQRLADELAAEADFEILVSDSNEAAVVSSLLREPPVDVLILDGRLFAELDHESQRDVRAFAARHPVLLLLDHVDVGTVHEVLRNRFQGYLLDRCPASQFARAIRAVSAGETWLPRSLLVKALEQWLVRDDDEPAPALPVEAVAHAFTDRERQVLALLRKGLSNKQIARELGVMEDTVKKHLQHVYDKLGVRRRTLVLVSDARV